MNSAKQSDQQTALVRIVDDDASLCDALRFMLRSEGWTSASWTSASQFLEEDDKTRPGCVILDYQMPGINGVELQQIMLHRGWSQPIIFLTAHGDMDMAINVFRRGAADVLKKPVNAAQFLSAVASAVQKDEQQRSCTNASSHELELLNQLTPREAEVLGLVALGLMNCQVASRLYISERTVEGHRASGYRRLGVKTLAELHLFIKRIGK